MKLPNQKKKLYKKIFSNQYFTLKAWVNFVNVGYKKAGE